MNNDLDPFALEDGATSLRDAITSINNGADFNGDVTANQTGTAFSRPGVLPHLLIIERSGAIATARQVCEFAHSGLGPARQAGGTQIDGRKSLDMPTTDKLTWLMIRPRRKGLPA